MNFNPFFLTEPVAKIVSAVGDKLVCAGESYDDMRAQQDLIAQLTPLLPVAGFIAEETNINELHEFTWVIDPVDGTTNRAIGLPWWCVSVGLMQNNTPVFGVIYAPVLQQLFVTTQDFLLLNGERVTVSTRPLAQAVGAVSFPRKSTPERRQQWQLVSSLRDRCYGVRAYGAVALECAYLAAGIIDFAIYPAARWWDIAAGIACIAKAGGVVLRGELYADTQQFIACNPAVVPQLQVLLQSTK